MAQDIQVEIGGTVFAFGVDDRAYNKFVDGMSGGKLVLSGYNLLSSTVKNEQHAAFKGLVTDGENNPKASVVMEVIGIISDEFNSELPTVVKTRASSVSTSKKAATNNS